MERLLNEHRTYVLDERRLQQFREALRYTVQVGTCGVDLGCGTGVLGLLACRAGASRVFAIDSSGIIEAARAVAKQNGLPDRIVHIRGKSTAVSLPTAVDFVVCDQMGPLGFDAGIVGAYDDARRRWLRAGGRLVPSAVATWFAPAESSVGYAPVSDWQQSREGLDFRAFREPAVNTVHRVDPPDVALLAEGVSVLHFDLMAQAHPCTTGEGRWTVTRSGTLHGLCGWFVAELAPGVTLTNDPSATDRIRRRPALLPVDRPIIVDSGDCISGRIDARPAENVLRWRVEVSRGRTIIAAFDHTTLRGLLLSTEDLKRAAPK